MSDQPKKTRRPAQPRGFVLELGTAADVARAGELGRFAGLVTKSELEAAFVSWLTERASVEEFLEHLGSKGEQRLAELRGKKSAIHGWLTREQTSELEEKMRASSLTSRKSEPTKNQSREEAVHG